jgi:Mor family transcriptional regulator
MKLTDQQKIEVVNRYLNGESSPSLAKAFNISRQSILSILKIRKVEIRNGK